MARSTQTNQYNDKIYILYIERQVYFRKAPTSCTLIAALNYFECRESSFFETASVPAGTKTSQARKQQSPASTQQPPRKQQSPASKQTAAEARRGDDDVYIHNNKQQRFQLDLQQYRLSLGGGRGGGVMKAAAAAAEDETTAAEEAAAVAKQNQTAERITVKNKK